MDYRRALANVPERFRAPLQAACVRFNINSLARVAAFLGQIRVESAEWTALQENLRYRTPEVLDRVFSAVRGTADAAALIARGPEAIANRVYAGRLGNGDEASGDGWRYRGRGLKQLTGRYNYAAAGKALGRPYIEQPDLLLQPEDACLTAAWFWSNGGCNERADASDWDGITRVVNGPGMLQASTRKQFTLDLIRTA